MSEKVSRRFFLKAGGLAGAAALVLQSELSAEVAAQQTSPAKDVVSPFARTNEYVFFNPSEAAFVEAALDRLIPSDATGPGAVELGVGFYIDAQLEAAFGNGEKMYLDGPFLSGEKTQGYQLPLRPKELYRIGILETDEFCRANYANRNFSALPKSEQESVLKGLETGKAQLASVPGAIFFATLWQNTLEGYFGDPVHGGNRGMGSWKMLGHPGARADFRDDVGKPERIVYPPVSLAQINSSRNDGKR